jgi:hypothetical protein
MADLNLNQVMRPLRVNDYLEPYKTNGSVSGTHTLDITGYNIHQIQVAGNLTLNFTGWHSESGVFQSLILFVVNGGYTVAWPAAVHNAPDIDAAGNYIVVLTTPNQGTDIIANLYGAY